VKLAPLALALAAIATAAACTRTLRTADLLIGRHPGVVYGVATDAPLVALTLDDGPDPIGTPALLEVLARHGATATFFVLGERLTGNEAVVQRIVDGGHELGNHGLRDEPAIDLPPEVFERELEETHRRLLPFQPRLRWYRPGSGWYDDWMIETLARHDYTLALGSIYPLDAQQRAVSFSTWWVRVDAEPGEVVVLHDGPERGVRSAEILDRLLPELSARGLRAVTLSELVD
jgi:peptidoglycan/xylan/chitin deacetylase (PgdA/CDA1 family)